MYIINTMFILYNSVYKISNTKFDNINPPCVTVVIFNLYTYKIYRYNYKIIMTYISINILYTYIRYNFYYSINICNKNNKLL